jgi:ubiquitin C-terminal hydrolase
MILKNENNSCYINSLLVVLFLNKDFFSKASVNDYGNSQLKVIGNNIKKCLNRKCKNNFRVLLNNYYNILKTIKKINIIDVNDNWINTPNDVFDFLDFLKIIFNVPNTTKFIENNKINYTDFSIILPYDFTSSIIYIKNEINNYLKANYLFIKFYRNIGTSKLNTIIIPAKSIKLKENKFLLYLNSLIIHYGDNNHGHYITIYKNKNKWYEFDDMKSKPVLIGSFNNICNNYNYLSNIVALVYSK